MSRYFDEQETVGRGKREKDQGEALRLMAERGCRKSPFFRKTLEGLSLEPAQLASVKELEKLPVITREILIDLQKAEPPFGGLADPEARIDRIFVSPGPVYEPHLSESDPLWARAYTAAGLGPHDIVLNAFSHHLVAAGLTFHGGLRRIGATVVPSGTSGAQIQVQLIRDLRVTAYTGTPSFLMAIIRKAEEEGYAFRKNFSLRKACFAAEPLEASLRERFENEYGIDTYQMYGATEVGDIAYECSEKRGWHLCEEVLVEIVDPATGQNVPRGALGQVVVTRFNPLFFLFRFGTGDLSRLIEEPCSCGRTSCRLDGIFGRIGDAVKVRGLFVAPSQLKEIQKKHPGIRFQLLIARTAHEDHLTVRFAGEAGKDFKEKFCSDFREICTVRIDHMERISPDEMKEGDPLILDRRDWR
ncbi:MAG: AMP-binding protein [Deltaproteobacteria bacterium]|nr:AMP-binding protein [Deltaproteobacteria bacterium]